MFSKPVSQLQLTDLDLVRGVTESERLEFKREPYGRTDEDVREMLRDLSSMANASGGFLMIGADTDGEDRATGFPGVENAADEASRMLSSFRANIEEQILGLDFGLVEVAPGRSVIVWGIPRSTRAPHLITFKGLNQFWRRHGRQKARMTIEEIRAACVRVENLRRSVEEFIQDRLTNQLRDFHDRAAMMLLFATPLVVRDEVLDTGDRAIRALLQDPPMSRRNGFGIPRGREPRPSLYGLVLENGAERTKLFRNGHMECEVDVSNPEQANRLNPWAMAEVPLNFLMLVAAVAEHLGLQEPFVVSVSLAGVAGWELPFDRLRRGRWTDRRDMIVPPMQFPYPVTPGPATKHIADRIWNGFGLEACPLFDEQGQFDANRLQL